MTNMTPAVIEHLRRTLPMLLDPQHDHSKHNNVECINALCDQALRACAVSATGIGYTDEQIAAAVQAWFGDTDPSTPVSKDFINRMRKALLAAAPAPQQCSLNIGAGTATTALPVVEAERQRIEMQLIFVDGEPYAAWPNSAGFDVYGSGIPEKAHIKIVRGAFVSDQPKPAKVYVCGVTCHPGDENCNNYCNMAPQKGPMADAPRSTMKPEQGES